MKSTLVVDCRILNTGIGSYSKNIIREMSSNDLLIISVIIPSNATSAVIPKNVNKIFFKSKIYSILEQLEFTRKIKRCKVFWSTHYNIPLLPISARKRLVTIHDVYHLYNFKNLSFLQKLYSKLVIKAAIKLSDKIITVSNFSKAEIVKYTNCDPNKIKVVYNGVEQQPFTEVFEVVQKQYDLPSSYILFVGNVKPHKNLLTLLRAYLLLKPQMISKYKLLIVGKKQGFITGDEEIDELVNGNVALKDNVIFTGFVADEHLSAIYKNAAVFVFPSTYEGFGIPPIEAMVNNCPVISSNAACMPEICGDAAIYFSPKESTELKDRIELVLNDQQLRQELIKKGNKQAQRFTWQESARKHAKIILSLNNKN